MTEQQNNDPVAAVRKVSPAVGYAAEPINILPGSNPQGKDITL
jgi:hypothetical protein